MKTATLKQKAVILGMLHRLCQDPQALVEIYLNYDCDSEAVDNIYEQFVISQIKSCCSCSSRSCSLINVISKLSTAPMPHGIQRSNDPTSPSLQPTTKVSHNTAVPPSLSVTALSVPGSLDTASLGLSEQQLKRQGLECLVAVLRSLVTWGTATTSPVDGNSTDLQTRSLNGEEGRQEVVTPDPSLDRLSGFPTSYDNTRQPTPELTDDPTKFESAKQKKTTLLEGVKKFNFKPKRVR